MMIGCWQALRDGKISSPDWITVLSNKVVGMQVVFPVVAACY